MRFLKRPKDDEVDQAATATMEAPQPVGPQPGDVWEGYHCYSDDYELVDRPGFYALEDDARTVNPELRLTWVDLGPGDDTNRDGYFEVAHRKSGSQRSATGEDYDRLYERQLVQLQAHAEGTATMNEENT